MRLNPSGNSILRAKDLLRLLLLAEEVQDAAAHNVKGIGARLLRAVVLGLVNELEHLRELHLGGEDLRLGQHRLVAAVEQFQGIGGPVVEEEDLGGIPALIFQALVFDVTGCLLTPVSVVQRMHHMTCVAERTEGVNGCILIIDPAEPQGKTILVFSRLGIDTEVVVGPLRVAEED